MIIQLGTLVLAGVTAAGAADVPCSRHLVREVRRAMFAGAAVLVAAPVAPAAAADPDCVLNVEHPAREGAAAWARLGYALQPSSPGAGALEDRHFALTRGATDDLWLSVANAGAGATRTVVRVPAPARGADPDARFACDRLRAQKPRWAEGQRAVGEVLNLARGRRISRTVGEAMLDLERNFMTHLGLDRYVRVDAKARYLELLAKVRALAPDDTPDFYARWFQVRRLVYGPGPRGVKYCDEKASMIAALVDGCVNCVGETYLMTALFIDAGFKPPASMALGAQLFAQHMRPVLYDPREKKTYDLVTGQAGPFRTVIAKPEALYVSLLKGDDGLRTADQRAAIAKLSVGFVHRDWSCVFAGPGRRAEFQSANLIDWPACGPFDRRINPHRGDNAGKVASVYAVEDPSGRPVDPAIKDPVSDLALDPGTIAAMRRVLPNLIPDERAAFESAVARPVWDLNLARRIGQNALTRRLGYGYLIKPDAEDRVIPFLQVEEDAAGGEISVRLDQSVITARTANPELAQRLRQAPLSERLAILIEAVAHIAEEELDELDRAGWPGADANAALEIVFSNDDVPNALNRLAFAMRVGRWLTENSQSDYADDEDDDEAPLKLALARTFLAKSGLDQRLTGLVRAAERLSVAPSKVVQWIEEDPTKRAGPLLAPNGILSTLSRVINEARRLREDEPRVNKWRDFPESANVIGNAAVLNLLTDPRYFFTVRPEDDEQTPSPPRAPVPLADVRVADETQRSGRVPARAINLPTWPTAACDASAGQNGTAVVVECGKDDDGPLGRDAVSTSARAAGTPVTDEVDPRAEVHLNPATWRALIDSVDPQFLSEPVTLLLLHHAYRRRLAPVFDDPVRRARLRVIDVGVQEKPTMTLTLEHWEEFSDPNANRADRKAADVLRLSREDSGLTDGFAGFADAPFVRAARIEVTRGKHGFLYEDAGAIAPDVDSVRELLKTSSVGLPATRIPARTRVEGRLVATLDETYGIPRAVFGPESRLHVAVARNPRLGAGRNVTGVLRPVGQYLGQTFVTITPYGAK